MKTLLKGERGEWAEPWLALCRQLDPDAPADEQQLAAIAQAYTDYLHRCKAAGFHFIQPGRFVLRGYGRHPDYSFSVYYRPDAGSVPLAKAAKAVFSACCAIAISTIVTMWSKVSISIISSISTARLCWWIA